MSTIATTTIISWSSLIISLISVFIAGATAWFATLRQPKIVGVLSGLEFKNFSSLGNGTVTDRKIVPFLFLKNTGARSAIIELLRLKFCFPKGDVYYAYPRSFNKTKSTEHFIGFALETHETWVNVFPFILRGRKYDKLADRQGEVVIEVKFINKRKWKKIQLNPFSFHAANEFLLQLRAGKSGSSFVWSDTVYSPDGC